MKISLNTEVEEIAELRAAVAIIEDAIKRRESPNEENIESMPQETNSEPMPEQEPVPEQNMPEQNVPPQVEAPEQPAQPSVDLSPLATSDYGERVESRSFQASLETEGTESAASVAPPQDNKSIVIEVINTLKNKNPGKPVYMQDILDLSKEKSVSEEDARNLVSELQNSGEI